MERSGKLVATSTQEPLLVKPAKEEGRQLLAVNSKDTRTRDIARQLTNKFGNFRTLQNTQQLNLVSNHKRQFVRVSPYRDNYGLDWLVVVVVAESDFMKQIHANNRITILLCSVALVGSIGVGILTARWITKPIQKLNTAAKNIAQGEWDKPVELERADEVGELANSFNSMAAQLQQSFTELQSLNQTLAQRESQLRQFLDAIPVGVSIHEATGKVLYLNSAAMHLIGLESIPEAVTEEFAATYQIYRQNQLCPTEELPAIRALRGETVFDDDLELHRDGLIIPFEIRATPIFDEQGNIIYCINAFADITQRKQAEQLFASYNKTLEIQVAQRTSELAHANELLNSEIAERKQAEAKVLEAQRIAHIGNWEYDVATQITTWSEELYRIHGLEPSQRPIQPDESLQYMHPEDREPYLKLVHEKASSGQPFEADLRILLNDGSIRHIETRGEPVFDERGQLVRLFGTVLDITNRKRAEEALQESQAQVQKLTNNVPGAIYKFVKRPDGSSIFEYISLTVQEIYELEPEQVIENSSLMDDCIHPDDRASVDLAINISAQNLEPFQYEWRVITPSGKVKWVQARSKPERHPNGNIIWHGVIFDITDQKQTEQQLQQAHQKLSFHVQNSPLAVIEWDSQFRVQSWSHRAEEIFGWKIEEVLGKTMHEWHFIYEEDLDYVNQGANQMLSGTVPCTVGHNRNYTKEGTVIHCDWYTSMLLDESGNLVSVLSLTQDVSDVYDELRLRKRAEETLQQAAYAADAANRAKSTFLANMSHELRTPLNGILGYAQILQADKNSTLKQQDGINIIYHCGTHLLTLINDILDLSKIEADKLELYPEEIYFPGFLTELSDIFKLKAVQKDIKFTYHPINPLPAGIQADQKRLRQVLMNLLSNAVKFTDRGSVTFKVALIGNDRQEQSPITTIRFQIQDTGTGIPPEQLSTIFLPFEQVADNSHRCEGTGLGLAISQRIVEMMGSQIWVESTPGVGSTFWFDLQVPEVAISIQPMSLKSTQHIIGYSGEKRKILVVDDRWENRSVLINMLEPIGFELQEATNGQEGLDRAVEFQPDLILADLIMPAMDGFEMTRRLRQLSELQTTIIIAVSANAFEVSRQKCLESGCNDFLTKPIQSQALFDKIKDYLNLSWIYDNTDELQSSGLASSQNPPSSPAEMVFPPRHELLPLYEAVLTGDVEAVEYELIRIQEVSVEYMSFVIRVLELAQEFDYEQIAQFIEPYLS